MTDRNILTKERDMRLATIYADELRKSVREGYAPSSGLVLSVAALLERFGLLDEPEAKPRNVTKEEYDALERAFWKSVEVVDEERCWIKGCTKPRGHRGDCAIFL